MSTPAVHLRQISFSYPGTASILKSVDLRVDPGEHIGIIGPNGGGKTTLLRILLGLLTPRQGQVEIFGQPPEKVRHRVGYVPQHPGFRRDLSISVIEAVLLGNMPHRWYSWFQTRQMRDYALEMLQLVGLQDHAAKALRLLSGGELQRVLIARALAGRPDLVLLDEPTANIDARSEEDFLALLQDHLQHLTVLLVSHDISFIISSIRRVACLNNTLICHYTDSLEGKHIKELYGRELRAVKHERRLSLDDA